MKNKGLKIKDLVTVGVFAVIYFVVMFCVGMIGIVPILFLVYPAILAILSGVIIMLFMIKVQKPWGLFILGMIPPLVMFAMGATFVLPAISFAVIFTAELIRKSGDYKSFKHNTLAYGVFSTWICGSLMQMLLAKEQYIELSMMMGEAYVTTLEKLITYPNMILVFLATFISGIFGALLGKAVLKKQFEKAGIV